MAIEQVPLAPTALIIGCGFLGRLLAPKLAERGRRVVGVVRSELSAKALAAIGVQPLLRPVLDDGLGAALDAALMEEVADVYYLVPPARPTAGGIEPVLEVLEGPRRVSSLLKSRPVRRVIVASSTAVFGQAHGERVDADSPAAPTDQRGKLLLEAENIWRDSGLPAHIVRFAGLYGPGRIIGLQAVRDGAPLIGDPDAWLNVIHGDDAADLLLAVMMQARPAAIELGSDGSPVRRREYYEYLARCLGVAPPRLLDAAAAATQLGLRQPAGASPSRQCDNVITCQRTGWLPAYPFFRDGLKASFVAMNAMNVRARRE